MDDNAANRQMLADLRRMGLLCALREIESGKREPDHLVTAEAMQNWMDGYVEANWPDWPYAASKT